MADPARSSLLVADLAQRSLLAADPARRSLLAVDPAGTSTPADPAGRMRAQRGSSARADARDTTAQPQQGAALLGRHA